MSDAQGWARKRNLVAMESGCQRSLSVHVALAFVALIAGTSTGLAFAEDVRRLSASDPLYKLIGQVSTDEFPDRYGQGSFLGSDGCHVLTNFHVAFFGGLDAEGQPIVRDNPAVGNGVAFSYNPDESGKFQDVVHGKVVAYGNFMRGAPRGGLADVALIRLSECQKGIKTLRFDATALAKGIPEGMLSTLTVIRTKEKLNVVVMEHGCQAFRNTPVTGLILTTCIAEPGTSANLLLSRDREGAYSIVAIGSGGGPLESGKAVAINVSVSAVAKFLVESGLPVP